MPITAPTARLPEMSDFADIIDVANEQLGPAFSTPLKAIYELEGPTHALNELLERTILLVAASNDLEVDVLSKEKIERDATGDLCEQILGAEDIEDDEDALTAAAVIVQDHAERIDALEQSTETSDAATAVVRDHTELLRDLRAARDAAEDRAESVPAQLGPRRVAQAA